MEGAAAMHEQSHSSIERLDLDTLTSIFYHAVREPTKTQMAFECLTSITHVCRKWRMLALDLAELWGDVALIKAKTSDMFTSLLARARDAPLSTPFPLTSLAKSHHPSDEQLAYITSHPERFRTLWVRDRHRCDWVSTLSGKTLPNLDFLVIGSHTPSLNLACAPLQAPHLRSIAYETLFIPFEAPSLRSLRISMRSLPPLTFEFGYLKKVLSSVPNLGMLNLTGCLPISATIGDLNRPIELAHLKTVSLVGSCVAVSLFLSHLRPNNDLALMHLEIGSIADETDVGRLSSALKPHLSGSSRNTVRIQPNDEWFFEACTLSSIDKRKEERGHIFLRIDNPPNFEEQWLFSSLYQSLFQQFPNGQVEHLEIMFAPNTLTQKRLYLSTATAFRVSQLADSVHTIVYDINTREIPDNTVTDFDLIPRFLLLESNPPRLPYPKLERLVIRASDLVYSSMGSVDRAAVDLREWIEHRMYLGKPLRTLSLEGEVYGDSSSKAEDVAVWNTIAGVIDVDDRRTLLARSSAERF